MLWLPVVLTIIAEASFAAPPAMPMPPCSVTVDPEMVCPPASDLTSAVAPGVATPTEGVPVAPPPRKVSVPKLTDCTAPDSMRVQEFCPMPPLSVIDEPLMVWLPAEMTSALAVVGLGPTAPPPVRVRLLTERSCAGPGKLCEVKVEADVMLASDAAPTPALSAVLPAEIDWRPPEAMRAAAVAMPATPLPSSVRLPADSRCRNCCPETMSASVPVASIVAFAPLPVPARRPRSGRLAMSLVLMNWLNPVMRPKPPFAVLPITPRLVVARTRCDPAEEISAYAFRPMPAATFTEPSCATNDPKPSTDVS